MKHMCLLAFMLSLIAFIPIVACAEALPDSVSYPDGPILDSDLDGLTDVGESTVFKTNPTNPDSDSDGWYDGTEILATTDPLDATSPSATTVITSNPSSIQTPWVWYVTRASGLVAFIFSWLVIFLGIAVRFPGLKSIIRPIYSLSVHYILAVQTLFFAMFHGISFLFDPFILPTLSDAFIPFHISTSKIDPFPLALGILALYGFIVLVITSWIKPMIPQRLWRITHFLNIFVYGAVVAHALLLGTDMQAPLYRNIFIGANVFLMALLLINFALKLAGVIRQAITQRQQSEPPEAMPNVNLDTKNIS